MPCVPSWAGATRKGTELESLSPSPLGVELAAIAAPSSFDKGVPTPSVSTRAAHEPSAACGSSAMRGSFFATRRRGAAHAASSSRSPRGRGGGSSGGGGGGDDDGGGGEDPAAVRDEIRRGGGARAGAGTCISSPHQSHQHLFMMKSTM
eukprot:CAMPEP_0183340216 /NCGR_PEP_ID=MMETSP0164_2-20130417/6844_1 /TAXON_ID=221442 /ORGANISM="Coccolithus pelagicus ssp braarudi, Strain PLY182g" /LENGTH=148 /DNA_ID=CAMNT_0025510317 /DNA_START=382 /DNA_END=828 /DNA_ORIENTATION=+